MSLVSLIIDLELLQETHIALSTRQIELCKAINKVPRGEEGDALYTILNRQLDRTTRALEAICPVIGVSA